MSIIKGPNSDGIGSEQGAQGNKISSDVWLFNSITAGLVESSINNFYLNHILNLNIIYRSDGTARFVEKAPDSISSWVITGFAIDPVHGLGIIEQPIKVSCFICYFYFDTKEYFYFNSCKFSGHSSFS